MNKKEKIIEELVDLELDQVTPRDLLDFYILTIKDTYDTYTTKELEDLLNSEKNRRKGRKGE